MDMTQQVTFAAHSQRQANGSRGPFTVYEITDTNGTKWQCKQPVYNQATQLMGHTVTINGSVKQNGDYTNYYINEIMGAPQMQPPPTQMQPSMVDYISTNVVAANGAPLVPPVVVESWTPHISEIQKNESIHRQVAAKVAANLTTDTQQFWGIVGELFNYFQTGTNPNHAAAVEMAQAFPGSHPDNDIPF